MGTYNITSPQCNHSVAINMRRSRRSRIEYSGNGEFRIDLNALSRTARNNFWIANNDTRNWAPGDHGICRKVGVIFSPEPVHDQMFLFGVRPQHTFVRKVGGVAKSTGQPDRRVYGAVPTTVGPATSRVAVGTGVGVMLALNFAITGIHMWNSISAFNDLQAIRRQEGQLENAFNLVQWAMPIIDLKYQNANDLGAITNFVFQGVNDTGNQDFTRIGIFILRSVERYDSNTGEVKPLIMQ
jgi:hypothetical protein